PEFVGRLFGPGMHRLPELVRGAFGDDGDAEGLRAVDCGFSAAQRQDQSQQQERAQQNHGSSPSAFRTDWQPTGGSKRKRGMTERHRITGTGGVQDSDGGGLPLDQTPFDILPTRLVSVKTP